MVESSSKPTVLITGVSGYLGSHVALVFLKDGNYTVRGTVRDTKNEKKIAPLKKAFGELFDKMTLVEADLENAESLMKAVEGAVYVIHTASPFPLAKPKSEMDLINPALNGTKAVMEACKAHKVKKVVITSSIAAIMAAKPENKPKDFIFTEKNWSDPSEGTHIDPYPKSKTLAEKFAWDFREALPEQDKFDVITINPGFILGPAFVGAGFASGEVIDKIINGKFPALPKTRIACVDVRDVAMAHLLAITKPEAANKRFSLVNKSLWMTEIGQILAADFKKMGYKTTTTECPYWVAYCGSFFMSELSGAVKNWGVKTEFENT
jgi:nucleoside-diphosphate-sugar epimerase